MVMNIINWRVFFFFFFTVTFLVESVEHNCSLDTAFHHSYPDVLHTIRSLKLLSRATEICIYTFWTMRRGYTDNFTDTASLMLKLISMCKHTILLPNISEPHTVRDYIVKANICFESAIVLLKFRFRREFWTPFVDLRDWMMRASKTSRVCS